jgi:hypothetical protein
MRIGLLDSVSPAPDTTLKSQPQLASGAGVVSFRDKARHL